MFNITFGSPERYSSRGICWRCALRFDRQRKLHGAKLVRRVKELDSKLKGTSLARNKNANVIELDSQKTSRRRVRITKHNSSPIAKRKGRFFSLAFLGSPKHNLPESNPSNMTSWQLRFARGHWKPISQSATSEWQKHFSLGQWTPIADHPTEWELRLSRGQWNPISNYRPHEEEELKTRSSFNRTLVGLINEERKADDVVLRQRDYEEYLRLGRAQNLSRFKSSTYGGKQIMIEDNLAAKVPKHGTRPEGSFRRAFSTRARSSTQSPASGNLGNSAGFAAVKGPDVAPSKIREHLSLWQVKQNKEDEPTRAYLGLPRASFGVGMTRQNEISSDVAQEGDEGDVFDMDVGGDLHEFKSSLRPGDLVELISDNQCILAIFVQRFPQQMQLFTYYGRWVHLQGMVPLWFRVPGFCKPSDLNPVLPYVPSFEVPQNQLGQLSGPMSIIPPHAGKDLVHKLNDFKRQADSTYREHAQKIDKIFDKLAYEKRCRWMHVDDITKNVLEIDQASDVPKSTIWAVHRALMLNEMGFVPDPHRHWKYMTFEILSRQDIELIHQIQQWVREHQEFTISQVQIEANGKPIKNAPKTSTLAEFAKKIWPIIKSNEDSRSLTPGGDPGTSNIQIKPNPVAFRSIPLRAAQPFETLIFRFLELWSIRRAARSGSALWALGPMILRSTGVYREKDLVNLDQHAGFRFLQRVGVIAPWENRLSFDSRLALPGSKFDSHTDKLLISAAEDVQTSNLIDSMSDLRQDWGDMEVFCIDSADTWLVDDGFSIEPVAGDSSCFWIHVHIANPTAYFGPDNAMARYAEHIGQTLYFPEKSYNMLSPKVTQKHFSLDADRPVLTFSGKMTLQGDLLETRVTPSRIHNVVFVTPETVSDLLAPRGYQRVQPIKYTVGQPPPSVHETGSRGLADSLTPQQVEKLEISHQLGLAWREKCLESLGHNQGLEHYNRLIMSGVETGREATPFVSYTQMEFPWRRVLRKIEGDPTIELRTYPFDPSTILDPQIRHVTKGETMVSDIMRLAGAIGGSWCQTRGIPVVFRGTMDKECTVPPDSISRWQEALKPGQTAEALYLAMSEYSWAADRGVASVRANRHSRMGVDAYAQVTSPLRRYSDLIAHWQIEAALRSEAKLGRSLTEMDFPSLPFSSSKLESMLSHLSYREEIFRKRQMGSKIHWCNMLVMRAHHCQESMLPQALPEYLEGFVTRRGIMGWEGKIKELNLRFSVRESSESPNSRHIQVGDWWKLRIELATPRDPHIVVELVELISRV